ncbi:MAG: cobyric acid synthase [Eubacterium sp.]|nr:cobyric acid synthase [Eubacterium sp.]
MAKVIMVQGTMSGAGKSFLVAGLCRIMRRDGYRAAPFKSQNMALNSFVTKEGLEMGRAQAMQAEAAGMLPSVSMNPILLKPTDHIGSQVIVGGQVIGNMSAREYFSYKKELIPDIKKAFCTLAESADIIVIEGAGSPAEINLRENDIVNMGMADMVDAPVLLVGDIDRGGVFAQLLGTLMLLTPDERARVQGLIINKFRGDASLLDSGIQILEEKGGIPVRGVIPYMDIALEDEDSLTERFHRNGKSMIDIAVIRYPRISNFTDFNVFEQIPDVSVRYVDSVWDLGTPDLIFLPGSKNTMSDLSWMRENGLEARVKELAGKVPICGICGGYQMLGIMIADPDRVESGGMMIGMELLPATTRLYSSKVRRQVHGKFGRVEGIFSALSGLAFEGYEIHMGRTAQTDGEQVFFSGEKDVYGTYVHGIFDKGETAAALVHALAEKKNVYVETDVCEDYADFKDRQYDKLADILSECLNMEEIYGMLREARL